jgi:hypothetical protein
MKRFISGPSRSPSRRTSDWGQTQPYQAAVEASASPPVADVAGWSRFAREVPQAVESRWTGLPGCSHGTDRAAAHLRSALHTKVVVQSAAVVGCGSRGAATGCSPDRCRFQLSSRLFRPSRSDPHSRIQVDRGPQSSQFLHAICSRVRNSSAPHVCRAVSSAWRD